MLNVITNEHHLNNVMSLIYSVESELIMKKGALAVLNEEYDLGRIDFPRYEIRKRIVEQEIEDLLRNCR